MVLVLSGNEYSKAYGSNPSWQRAVQQYNCNLFMLLEYRTQIQNYNFLFDQILRLFQFNKEVFGKSCGDLLLEFKIPQQNVLQL